jgi:hypothetical protein
MIENYISYHKKRSAEDARLADMKFAAMLQNNEISYYIKVKDMKLGFATCPFYMYIL